MHAKVKDLIADLSKVGITTTFCIGCGDLEVPFEIRTDLSAQQRRAVVGALRGAEYTIAEIRQMFSIGACYTDEDIAAGQWRCACQQVRDLIEKVVRRYPDPAR